jgi:hypothetical protein
MSKSPSPPARSKRSRGTMSLPCPRARCGGKSEVLRTGRDEAGVLRQRRCMRCGKTFFSCEAVKETA